MPTALLLLHLAIGAQSISRDFQPFPAPSISEVVFEGGSAHATSAISAKWSADKAFILGHANGWHVGGGATDRIFPAMVWYKFPEEKAFVPARVSFRGRQDRDAFDQVPAMWQFIGSNDENCGQFSQWTVLCEDLSNAGVPHRFWTKYCTVDDGIFTKFRCFGISVLNVANTGGAASLKDVRIWKKNC